MTSAHCATLVESVHHQCNLRISSAICTIKQGHACQSCKASDSCSPDIHGEQGFGSQDMHKNQDTQRAL